MYIFRSSNIGCSNDESLKCFTQLLLINVIDILSNATTTKLSIKRKITNSITIEGQSSDGHDRIFYTLYGNITHPSYLKDI